MDNEKLMILCWNKALYSVGTSYIFNKRSMMFRRRLGLINLLGIIVPLTIGAFVLTYGLKSPWIENMIFIALPILIFQVVFSGISIVYKWDDELAYSYESTTKNRELSEQFEELAKLPPGNIEEFINKYEKICISEKFRNELDDRRGLTDKEKRMGLRYGLRNYQRPCVNCNIIPMSMESTDCPVCGKF